ncbi:MAG: alpha/beta fold hydrolase [Cytophagaceae bacterium]|nr:alpha/beta fold hydrolase [Gemmatimonadaceae bacterium]
MISLLLLHGALGDRAQLSPLARLLAEWYDVHAIELEGHGTTPIPGDAYDLARFRDNVRHAMAERGMERAAIFGYSMGGYVALSLAAESPDLVSAIVTLGTKLAWSPEAAARETSRLDPVAIRAKVPKFADLLERRHAGAGGWELALARGDVAVVPATPHPFEQVRVPLVAALTRDFLDVALSTQTSKPA